MTKKSGKKRPSKPTPEQTLASKEQALAAKRTPLRLRPRGKWLDASAARDALREHESLTRALLSPGARRDILSYVLGMRTLMIGLPDLTEALQTAEPTQQAGIVREALQDRARVELALAGKGVSVSPLDNISTPVGVGSTVAMQFGSELEAATVYVLDPSAFYALLDVADRLTLDDCALLDWRGTGTENGLVLFPETLYVEDDEDDTGNMIALSWAPGRSLKHAESLRATSWSQTYGDASDADWNSVLEAAEREGVALPRLTYGGMAWALPPRGPGNVDLTPTGLPLVTYEDGVVVNSGEGTLLPRLALAIVNMMREGVLFEARTIEDRGVEARVLSLTAPDA